MQERLKDRLERLWERPDFSRFFRQYATRQPLQIRKGKTIFFEGDEPDRIYFIRSGFVKMYRSSDEGRDTIIYLYGPGQILGIRALTSEDRCLRHTAEAMTDVEIVTLARSDYLSILSEHPEYIVDLLHTFIDRLNYTEHKLEGFILSDSTARVASFLSDCAARFGVKKEKSVELPMPLTHQAIADFVGAYRETVTVALNRLEKENVIAIEKHTINITNLPELQKHALLS